MSSGTLQIGNGGTSGSLTGTLTKEGGGSLTLSGNNTVTGNTTVNDGTLLVEGSLGNSNIQINNGSRLGGSGTVGNTEIQDGGTLVPGSSPGQLTIAGNLFLAPNAALSVELGDPSGTAGVDSDLIDVSGNLTLDGTLDVADAGGFGPGLYRLINYAGVLTDNGLEVGASPRGYISDDLYVGSWGEGTLIIESGATVNSRNGRLGYFSTGDGTATVTGGGRWINQGNLILGNDSIGTLNIGNADLSDTAGQVTASELVTGNNGSGTVNFNQTDDITFSIPIAGNISVNQLGAGTTMLSGTSTYSGDTTITDGTLLVNGAIANSQIILNGGALGGSGMIGGVTVYGGTVAPGNSIGTFAVAGDWTLGAGATYQVELIGRGTTAGTHNDLIDVTGIATVEDGALVHVTPENSTDKIRSRNQSLNRNPSPKRPLRPSPWRA